jgi:hypothetical protein
MSKMKVNREAVAKARDLIKKHQADELLQLLEKTRGDK